jgi:hypothetical protein
MAPRPAVSVLSVPPPRVSTWPVSVLQSVVHPAVYELPWDEAIQEKLWTKHRVMGREVGDVVFDDPGAEFRWHEDRRHGRRLLVRGRTRSGRRLMVILDSIDLDQGVWRCRTAWEER